MAKKILIVEDDQDIVDLLKYNLEKEGFKCYSASNGAEAVGIAMNKEPDLIILDIMMPELDGIETCRVIKSKPKLHDTFVIFLTARAEEYSEIAGFEAGADDYITKPVKPRVLISRIKAILSRKKDQRSISKIQHGDLVIDRDTFKVSIQNKHFTLEYAASRLWVDEIINPIDTVLLIILLRNSRSCDTITTLPDINDLKTCRVGW